MGEIFNDSKLDEYTDAQLLAFVINSPQIITTRIERHAKALSHNLVAKYATGDTYHDEIAALRLAQELGIQVPAIRRLLLVDAEDDRYVIILQRIHGQTLEQTWHKMGWWQTIHLGLQLRRYIRAMHMVTSKTAGGLTTGSVASPYLESIYLPARHSSPTNFTNYLNWWLVSCRPERFKPRTDLVLTPPPSHHFIHQDLAPRNLMVDCRNTLWVIDWGCAGFYPAYMEGTGFNDLLTASSWSGWFARQRWLIFRWLAIGCSRQYSSQRIALGEIHRRSCIYRIDKNPYSEFS